MAVVRMHAKHYTAISRAIRDCADGAPKPERERLERLAYMLADWFADENPLFVRERFLTECGY